MTEDLRYNLYRIGAHTAWWGALAMTIVVTWLAIEQSPLDPPSAFQRLAGILIVFMIGIGIAVGSALARMRLARTIAKVFETGMLVSARVAGADGRGPVEDDGESIDGLLEHIGGCSQCKSVEVEITNTYCLTGRSLIVQAVRNRGSNFERIQ